MEVSCIMGPPVTTEQTLSSEKIVESCRKTTSSETFLLFSRSEHINLTLPRHGFQTGPAITHVKWCFDPSAGPCSRYHTLVLCCCQTAHFSESQNSWENVLLDQKPVCLTSFYCEIKRPLIWKYILYPAVVSSVTATVPSRPGFYPQHVFILVLQQTRYPDQNLDTDIEL